MGPSKDTRLSRELVVTSPLRKEKQNG